MPQRLLSTVSFIGSSSRSSAISFSLVSLSLSSFAPLPPILLFLLQVMMTMAMARLSSVYRP